MPIRQTRVDAFSGIISFTNKWTIGNTVLPDAHAAQYERQTYTFSCYKDAAAEFEFYGYEIAIIGAIRMHSGQYEVFIDDVLHGPFNQTVPENNEAATTDSFFNYTLWSWQGTEGLHRVMVQNVPVDGARNPTSDFDLNCFHLDYIIWNSTVNSIEDYRIQDGDSLFEYNSVWQSDITGLPDFDKHTGHVAWQDGSTVKLTFSGARIELYGPSGSAFGPYYAKLDDEAEKHLRVIEFPARIDSGQQVLFAASGLSPGQHTLQLRHDKSRATQLLAIDYAVVDGAVNGDPDNTSSFESPNGASSALVPTPSARTMPTTEIVGIAIVSAMVFAAFALVLAIIRWRQLRKREHVLSGKSGSKNVSSETRFIAHVTVTPYLIAKPLPPARTWYPSKFRKVSNLASSSKGGTSVFNLRNYEGSAR